MALSVEGVLLLSGARSEDGRPVECWVAVASFEMREVVGDS